MRTKKDDLQDLFLQAEQGDQEALYEILKRFEPLVVAESRINGLADEDVAQEIREKFYTELKKNFSNNKSPDK